MLSPPGSVAKLKHDSSSSASCVVEIVSVVDGKGKAVPLPPNQTTPLTLVLDAGAYDLTLRHGTTRTVRTQVGAASLTTPMPIPAG